MYHVFSDVEDQQAKLYQEKLVSLQQKLKEIADQAPKRLQAWQKLANEAHDKEAIFKVGVCFFHGLGTARRPQDAFNLFSQIEPTHADGRFHLGYCFYRGLGCEADQEKSKQCFHEAAMLQHVKALCNLGVCEYHTETINDYLVAAGAFKLSAAAGDPWAFNNLGVCFHYGQGVEQNDELAALLYEMSIALGQNTLAECNLGRAYLLGRGVKQDEARASELFLQAAKQNDPYGQFYLAECYEQGAGVKKDVKTACKWYDLAKTNQHPFASERLDKLQVDAGAPAVN